MVKVNLAHTPYLHLPSISNNEYRCYPIANFLNKKLTIQLLFYMIKFKMMIIFFSSCLTPDVCVPSFKHLSAQVLVNYACAFHDSYIRLETLLRYFFFQTSSELNKSFPISGAFQYFSCPHLVIINDFSRLISNFFL